MPDFFPSICKRTAVYLLSLLLAFSDGVYAVIIGLDSCLILLCVSLSSVQAPASRPPPQAVVSPSVSPPRPPACSGLGSAVSTACLPLVVFVLLHVSLNGVFPHSSEFELLYHCAVTRIMQMDHTLHDLCNL